MNSRGASQVAPAENRGGFRPFNPPSNSGAARNAPGPRIRVKAAATIGTALHRVRRDSSETMALTPADMAIARIPARNSICGSRSCGGRHTEVDLREAPTTAVHMADHVALHRATAVPMLLPAMADRIALRVTAEVVEAVLQAEVEAVAAPTEAAEAVVVRVVVADIQVAEAVAIRPAGAANHKLMYQK